MFKHLIILVTLIGFLANCGRKSTFTESSLDILKTEGTTLETRFSVPEGYTRLEADSNSFTHYLRTIPLKKHGSLVKYYNGASKPDNAYCAVVDLAISKRDLHQCADAVMRLRAEYLFQQKKFSEISFTLMNGFKMNYSKWMEGYRVSVKGNTTSWYKAYEPTNRYGDLQNYLEFVYTYAGSLSLSKMLKEKKIDEITPGDVFILGGSPGHTVTVMDVATNEAGKRIFILSQSYMPAQETQILKNFNNSSISPWFEIPTNGTLETPEWTFKTTQLKTW